MKHADHTGRIPAQGQVPITKDRGLIFSQYGLKQAWLRDLLYDRIELSKFL